MFIIIEGIKMKNFMFIYEGGDPDWHAKSSPEDLQAQMAKWEEWMGQLAEKGQLVSGGDPLHNGGVRVDATGTTTDIAAAEFKDLVSGYSIVAANNMQEATELAKTCPIFFDSAIKVQVREILAM